MEGFLYPHQRTCKECGQVARANFCPNCGQSLETGKINLAGMWREVTSFFTGPFHGFSLTLLELTRHPGTMQRDYLLGHRRKHAKPFSMLAICALVAAVVSLFFAPTPTITTGAAAWWWMKIGYIFLMLFLVPVYSLVVWILFRNCRVNYAECLVFMAYTLALPLFFSPVIFLIQKVAPQIPVLLYLAPLLMVYLLRTNFKLFIHEKKGWVIVKTTLVVVVCVGMFSLVEKII